MAVRGIILAGGKGTRLYPATACISKQLLPVYDKPMIYYPLSVLMLAGIRDVLLISTPTALPSFEGLLGDGSRYGIAVQYAVQEEPRGIADALVIGEDFAAGETVCLILGDNIFYGDGLSELLQRTASLDEGAVILGCHVSDPGRYGVIECDRRGRVISIEEKPDAPRSNCVSAGLYFYDADAAPVARQLSPSARGELEITDVNNEYLRRGKLKLQMLGRGYTWLDTGTCDSLLEASTFVRTVEKRQGLKIGCVEEVAYRMGYIDSTRLMQLVGDVNTEYGAYLTRIARDGK